MKAQSADEWWASLVQVSIRLSFGEGAFLDSTGLAACMKDAGSFGEAESNHIVVISPSFQKTVVS